MRDPFAMAFLVLAVFFLLCATLSLPAASDGGSAVPVVIEFALALAMFIAVVLRLRRRRMN